MTEKMAENILTTEISVRCRILCNQKKKEISPEINSKAYNLSRDGVHLTWPKSWGCEICLKCRAWVFNHSCAIKKKRRSYKKNFNRYLDTSNFVQLEVDSPEIEEPIKLKAKVAWVKPEEGKREYKIGLSFLKGEERKLKGLELYR